MQVQESRLHKVLGEGHLYLVGNNVLWFNLGGFPSNASTGKVV